MKDWPCRICGKIFSSYGNVQQHRQVHSVVRPYICRTDSCHQSFSLLSGYQAHRRWHANRRPYECRLCGKKFVHRNHKLSHRCGIGRRKLYFCHVCPQIFREILSFAYHVRHKHSKGMLITKRVCIKSAVSKKPKVHDLNNKKADSKILLKITAGKSMTIISPMKKSTSSHGKKRDKAKKSKRKQKEDPTKNSIILSIKKGSVKMSSETKMKTPKQDCFKRSNGQVNRVVESCDKGSKLKMKIKTLTDKSASPLSNEIVNRYSYPSSPSHARKSKKVTTKCSSDTEHKVESVLSDSIADESRVRNGIVIVKDKSGKFLAEQLQSAKAKKRENVFDSFSDPGLWKVLPSPRHDSSLDYLKLKLSPQKPLRLDSGIDLPCDRSKYLDIGVPGKSLKVENYSEDSDVFEASPGVDKDSDPGLQNVNDSGIEILSSSSCNRSNENSVRSVLLDDNSPTYFPTEDSLLSLDSPVTDIHLKPDQSICGKCGGTLMETNNNTHSPRKCHCSNSLVNSPSQALSPLKSSTHIASQDNQTSSPADCHPLNVETSHCDNSFEMDGKNNKHGPDDIDIIVLGESDGICPVGTEKVSEYEDVEIIRNKTQSDLKLRLKLKTKKTSVSNLTKSEKADNSRGESIVNTEVENVISSSEPSQVANTEPKCDKRTSSEFKKDCVYSVSSLSGSDTAPVLTKEDTMVSYKGKELQCVTDVDFPSKAVSSKMELNGFDVCHKLKAVQHMTENINTDNDPCKEVKSLLKSDNENDLVSCDLQSIDGEEQTTNNDPSKKEVDNITRKMTKSDPCEKEGNKIQMSDHESKDMPCFPQFLTEDSTLNKPCKKEVKKKPLFKSKNKKPSLSSEGNDNILDKVIDAGVTTEPKGHEIDQLNHGMKKKPIFKKRSCSGDSTEFGSKPETSSKLPEQPSKTDSVFLKDTHNVEMKHTSDKIDKSDSPDINLGWTETISVDKKPLNNDKQKPTQVSDPFMLTLDLKVQDNEPQLEDSDSLLQIPCTDSKAQSTKDACKKSCTSPLDLFQQQFLSFLSTNKDKPKDHPSCVKEKQEKAKNSPDKDYLKAEPCKEKPRKKTETCNKNDDISITFEGDLKNKAISEQKKDKLSLKKPKSAGKEKVKQPAENKHCINKVQSKKKDHEKEKDHKDKLFDIPNIKDKKATDMTEPSKNIKDKKAKDMTEPSKLQSQEVISFGLSNTSDKKSNIDHSHLETRTDSLSWLKIFSESIENKSAANKDNRNSSEEITDFSADLAAINNKMDVSDDELNNLDVDHVFKSSNLASLQPKALGDRNVKKHETQTKRPQKAKRSIGPFKGVKRDYESDSEFSDNSSFSGSVGLGTNAEFDTDYNPFHDSDGDFDIGPTFSKGKGRKKLRKKHFFDDSDSDDFTNLNIKAANEKVNSSRTKRLKQGRKSCCPCCIGSPEKISKEYHPHHTYTLPKNSKQFVKSSMKLLELQAKIHQLFLSLFPDCAEIISNSKIGTEEFEVLIDDVLGSLEDQDISFEESSVDRTHSYMEGLYSCENNVFCNTYNQTDPNDLLQTESSFHKCDMTKENFTEKGSKCYTEESRECCRKSVCSLSKTCIGSSYDDNKYLPKSATKDLRNPFHSVCETDLQSPSESFHPSLPMEPPWNDVGNMSCEDASEFCMDSDITITIDLNAAKVSLCRDPKNCLERLNNRIARLVQCLLPNLKLKKTFFRNIDNLHFLLDLLITANLPGSSTNLPLSDDESDVKMIGLSTNEGVRKLDFSDIGDKYFSDSFTNANMSHKGVNLSKPEGVFSGTKLIKRSHLSPEERVPLLSKFQDEFEQEIKSHRESLKKDIFDSHTHSDNIDQTSFQKAKEVLTAIRTIEKLNKVKQKPRPRRDPRLRKNEAESRKLFVQEKILNNQNSTIVCHTSPKKSKKFVRKSRRKNKDSQNSKESFLSGLDLGEISPQQTQPDVKTVNQEGDETLQYNNDETDTKYVIEESKHDMEDKEDVDEVPTRNTEGDGTTSEDSKSTLDILQNNADVKNEAKVVENETEVSEWKDLSTVDEESRQTPDQAEKSNDSLVSEGPDLRQKSGEKNIFELMQPS